jgi:anti-sigma B factor antagonist
MPTKPMHPWVTFGELGDVTLVHFNQARLIDDSEIKAIGEVLFALADETARKKIVVSLAGAELLSSAMVGKLIAMHKKVHAHGGKMALCSLCPALARVFEIGGLKRVFTITDDQASAILAIGDQSPAEAESS